MRNKVFIWGFPGIGKSTLRSDLHVVDADCERFKYIFPSGDPGELHGRDQWEGITKDPAYPQNYLNYILSVDANVVLLNCHINLLEHLDKENLLLVYPSVRLKNEYLDRYIKRGDHNAYLEHMASAFEDMVDTIEHSPYRKIQISEPQIYLQDFLNGGSLMSQFVTKEELTRLFDGCIKFGIYTPPAEHASKTPDELSQLLFEGKIEADVDFLRTSFIKKQAEVKREAEAAERRGGLSREDLVDKIMQGIVNGALGIRYAEIAPYSHGYEVTFGSSTPGDTRSFSNRWEVYNTDLLSVPYKIADAISTGRQNDQVFGGKCMPLDIHKMLRAIEEMEARKIHAFTPEKETDFERATSPNRYPYRSSVATVMDVHAGKGLDGIVQHHYHGTYSTMTPVKQNSLVEALVCLKGFCLDCLPNLDVGPGEQQGIVDYLKAHGTDVSTPEKLEAWVKANPQKCGLEKNRQKANTLSDKIDQAMSKASAHRSEINVSTKEQSR